MPNRVAIVTGAIGALGTAMCKHLTNQDRTVVATHRPGDEPRKKAEQWQKPWPKQATPLTLCQ